ncbi:ATP-binding protein [Tamlana crocina]|uniref:histidine kinase n=1 Tax=Tamlana crocina TaxID=393006 RepID=A0ABX1DF64_9FLAO|nr:ATP-binding protein [Tamlana crocina]NJX16692.1 PAS domain-containing protein [Tamlana crocina]
MDFKRVYTSTKTYIILLISAFVLLLVMASMAYKQTIKLQESAEMITHTVHVYNVLGNLSRHAIQADSEEFKQQLLKKPTESEILKKYSQEGKQLIDSLKKLTVDNPMQQAKLKPLGSLLNKLSGQLYVLDTLNLESDQEFFEARELQKEKISKTLFNIRVIENQILKEEERLMHKRKSEYASHKFLAPLTSLILAFFALLISFISFLRIYRNKLRFKRSEALLKNILSTTDNVINYYEPIFNNANELVDYKIVFANECNRDYFDLEPDEIIGKKVSEVFPVLVENGDMVEMIRCYKERKTVVFDRPLMIQNEKMWFHSLVTPLEGGILVTARNTTAEENAKEAQLLFKKRLEKHNLELLNNRAFLSNILKSISHVVIHLKSVRNNEGKINDFKISFVNENVTPITGDIPEKIKNKKVSEVCPDIFNPVVLEHFVNVVEEGTTQHYQVPYYQNNREQWFRATAIKLGDGVTLTLREITEEKKTSDRLTHLNEELVIQNSILSDAENLAKIGSFIWNPETDDLEPSENFYRMLGGISENKKTPLSEFREYVHPEDIEVYDRRNLKSITQFSSLEHTFRIITKQGGLKYFKTNGQFVNKNGKMVMVGVVQDVTDTIIAEENLLNSNLKLKQSNAELEAFNRVASHDLQEPLRKIQLFISRIEDREIEALSDKGKSYFKKVTNAVQRMQSLIKNLLSYSRIDSSRTDFENINLDEILSNVEEDLATVIKETGVELIADKLPVLNGVAFQMEQLFTNLISNSLKYRNLTEAPKIEIRYELVDSSSLPNRLSKEKKLYHQITFSDNGIGFDSQHAEKIFEVFQRLHQKTEYTGNGIGLAICKKIAENHNGHIIAKSSVGSGAQFIVFLPV